MHPKEKTNLYNGGSDSEILREKEKEERDDYDSSSFRYRDNYDAA